VLCNATLEKQLEINDWTHANGISFIATETRGLFGYEHRYCLVSRLVSYHDSSIFNDFGPSFTCVDTNGQQALSGMIAAIANVCTINTSDSLLNISRIRKDSLPVLMSHDMAWKMVIMLHSPRFRVWMP
jgi:hypothetical protein